MRRSAFLGLALVSGLCATGCFSPEAPPSAGTDTPSTGSTGGTTNPDDPSAPSSTTSDPSSPTDPTTMTTGGDTDVDPSTSGPMGSESGSETGAPVTCGDGNVDPEEDCDDGNRTNGDGCNNNCVESGVIAWESAYDEGSMRATGLAVNEDGEVLVIGRTGSDEAVQYADWRRLYASNGDVISTGNTGGFDTTRIAASGDSWVIAYLEDPEFSSPNGALHETEGEFGIARVSALFDAEWSTLLPNSREIGQIHAREGGGMLVSGGVLNSANAYVYEHDGFVAAYNNGGTLEWERLDPDDASPRDCHPSAQLQNGGSVEACTRSTLEVFARRRHPDGGPAAEAALGEVMQASDWRGYFSGDRRYPAMAAGPSGESALIIGNRLFKLTPSTTEDWSQSLNTTGDEFFYAIAIDGAGAIVLGGRRQSASGSAGFDGVVIKLAPDGTEYWTHVVATDGDDEVRAIGITPNDRVAFCATEGLGTDEQLRVGMLTP